MSTRPCLTMYIPAQRRPIVDERFSRQLDDIAHLARIAELEGWRYRGGIA